MASVIKLIVSRVARVKKPWAARQTSLYFTGVKKTHISFCSSKLSEQNRSTRIHLCIFYRSGAPTIPNLS